MFKILPDTMPRYMLLKHSLWKALEKCQSKCVYPLVFPPLAFWELGGAWIDERLKRPVGQAFQMVSLSVSYEGTHGCYPVIRSLQKDI